MGEAFLRFPIMWCYNKSEIKQYLYGKNCFFLVSQAMNDILKHGLF